MYLQLNDAHGVTNARLNHKAGGGKTGAWSTLYVDKGQWIQIDLGQIAKVTKVGTQGRDQVNQWVTEYKISYSLDGGFYHFFKQSGYGAPRVSCKTHNYLIR